MNAMPPFTWADGNTPAQVRQQADSDMNLLMEADNWLVEVCPAGTFAARGSRRITAARAINAAAWFMARLAPAARQLVFSEIVFDPQFLSQLLQVVRASLPAEQVASLEAALQIWVAEVTSSTSAAVVAARDADDTSFFTLGTPTTRQGNAINALPAEHVWFERARVCDLGLDGDGAVPAAGLLTNLALDRYMVDHRIQPGEHADIVIEVYHSAVAVLGRLATNPRWAAAAIAQWLVNSAAAPPIISFPTDDAVFRELQLHALGADKAFPTRLRQHWKQYSGFALAFASAPGGCSDAEAVKFLAELDAAHSKRPAALTAASTISLSKAVVIAEGKCSGSSTWATTAARDRTDLLALQLGGKSGSGEHGSEETRLNALAKDPNYLKCLRAVEPFDTADIDQTAVCEALLKIGGFGHWFLTCKVPAIHQLSISAVWSRMAGVRARVREVLDRALCATGAAGAVAEGDLGTLTAEVAKKVLAGHIENGAADATHIDWYHQVCWPYWTQKFAGTSHVQYPVIASADELFRNRDALEAARPIVLRVLGAAAFLVADVEGSVAALFSKADQDLLRVRTYPEVTAEDFTRKDSCLSLVAEAVTLAFADFAALRTARVASLYGQLAEPARFVPATEGRTVGKFKKLLAEQLDIEKDMSRFARSTGKFGAAALGLPTVRHARSAPARIGGQV